MLPVILTMAPRDEMIQERCLWSLLNTGFSDPYVFAEPNTEIPPSIRSLCTDVVIRKERLGIFNNWVQAVIEVLEREPNAEKIITCQDDVVYCRNVAELVQREEWPEDKCGLVHVYTSKRYACYGVGKRSRLSDIHTKKMGGACCLVFSRRCLEDTIASLQERPWRGAVDRTVTGSAMEALDLFLGERLYSLGYTVWVHVPSLAQTIAKGSTVDHGGPHGPRTAAFWPGEDADALELFGTEIQGERHGDRRACRI